MTTDKIKRHILPYLPYALIYWFFSKVSEAYRLSPGHDAIRKLMGSMLNLNTALKNPMPTLNPYDILIGLIGAAAVYGIVLYKKKNAKKWRKDIEYGSARWGGEKDIEPYVDPKPDNNVIFTATESLMMAGRPSNPKYARNKNVLIVGGSGSGKTRFWLKPNLMQMHSSYIVTDPKGTILMECGKMLQRGTPKTKPKNGKDGKPLKNKRGEHITEVVRDRNGKIVYEPYEIKVLNTIDFTKSMHYNPFPLLYKGGKRNNPQNTRQSLRLRHKRTDTASAFQPGKEKVMNELTYERVGDYLLPCIRLSDLLNAPPLGRYGTMHKEYLRRERPALYATLLLTERLYPLCREVDEAAAHRLTVIGNREIAHEVILSELVYI